jgi:hypothetical protein
VSKGLKNSATPAATAITKKIAIAPMQISHFLRKIDMIAGIRFNGCADGCD